MQDTRMKHENQLQRIYALKLPVILLTFTSKRLNKIWAAQAATWAPRLKPTIWISEGLTPKAIMSTRSKPVCLPTSSVFATACEYEGPAAPLSQSTVITFMSP